MLAQRSHHLFPPQATSAVEIVFLRRPTCHRQKGLRNTAEGFKGVYTYTTINYKTAQRINGVRVVDEQLHKSHNRIERKDAHDTL